MAFSVSAVYISTSTLLSTQAQICFFVFGHSAIFIFLNFFYLKQHNTAEPKLFGINFGNELRPFDRSYDQLLWDIQVKYRGYLLYKILKELGCEWSTDGVIPGMSNRIRQSWGVGRTRLKGAIEIHKSSSPPPPKSALSYNRISLLSFEKPSSPYIGNGS